MEFDYSQTYYRMCTYDEYYVQSPEKAKNIRQREVSWETLNIGLNESDYYECIDKGKSWEIEFYGFSFSSLLVAGSLLMDVEKIIVLRIPEDAKVSAPRMGQHESHFYTANKIIIESIISITDFLLLLGENYVAGLWEYGGFLDINTNLFPENYAFPKMVAGLYLEKCDLTNVKSLPMHCKYSLILSRCTNSLHLEFPQHVESLRIVDQEIPHFVDYSTIQEELGFTSVFINKVLDLSGFKGERISFSMSIICEKIILPKENPALQIHFQYCLLDKDIHPFFENERSSIFFTDCEVL